MCGVRGAVGKPELIWYRPALPELTVYGGKADTGRQIGSETILGVGEREA